MGRKGFRGRYFSSCLWFSAFNSPVEEGNNHSSVVKVAFITSSFQ